MLLRSSGKRGVVLPNTPQRGLPQDMHGSPVKDHDQKLRMTTALRARTILHCYKICLCPTWCRAFLFSLAGVGIQRCTARVHRCSHTCGGPRVTSKVFFHCPLPYSPKPELTCGSLANLLVPDPPSVPLKYWNYRQATEPIHHVCRF